MSRPRQIGQRGNAVGYFYLDRGAVEAAARRKGYQNISELGEALGMMSQNYYRYLGGKIVVGPQTFARVLVLLGVPAADLLRVDIAGTRFRLVPE